MDTSCFVFKESKVSKVRPPYAVEFCQQIFELARAGRAPAELSREFGVTAQSITGCFWPAMPVRGGFTENISEGSEQ